MHMLYNTIFVDVFIGQATQNDEMRDELNGIIGGLQAYLKDVQNKVMSLSSLLLKLSVEYIFF